MKEYDLVVTGATGFVGASMIRHFGGKDRSVLATSRTIHPPKALYHFADYQALDLMDARLPTIRCKTLIHCASAVSENMNIDQLIRTNVDGLRRLLSAVETDHFIYISSASVYPPGKNHKEAEELGFTDLSNYGRSKLKAEEFLNALAQKITILRPRAIYGVGDRVLLPRILSLKKGYFFISPGDLHYEISLTCIENLLEATAIVMERATHQGVEVYNVSDHKTYQLAAIIERLIMMHAGGPVTKIRVSPSLLTRVGKWLRIDQLSPETFKYFLCDHTICNDRFCEAFDFNFSWDFEKYAPTLEDWMQSLSRRDFGKHSRDLPWKGFGI